MSPRVLSGSFVACMALLAGCSGGDGEYVADPAAYTVSYRNQVRLPWGGSSLTAERFATQLRARDPVAPVRCGAEESESYRDVTAFLGGIAWSHPMAIIKDASLPPLYEGEQELAQREGAASAGAADASGAPPNIERPDLVGVRNGIAVFLSKQHGLIAVDGRGATPTPSCSMKLPGTPMSFFVKGDELVVLVNALRGHNRSALLRYSFAEGRFRFLDAVKLPNQTIRDARLFDSTIVAYTDWTKERPAPEIPEPKLGSGPTYAMSGGGRSAAGAAAPDMGGAYNPPDRLGSKVIVVAWDDALAVDWEDSLLDDPVKQDPLEGRDPNEKLEPGQVVSTRKSWKPFVAASDRYVAIPEDVEHTKFAGYETYTYSVCTAYNPKHHQVESCNVSYEKRANPDYRPPNPSTGDYSCAGKKLEDCIKEAAPQVSQYVYVPVSQSCQMVWVGQCEKYEQRTASYPRFETEHETELTIYRFENGSFSKLDSTLAKMVEKADALAFESGPLSVKGAISNRNQVQFQNGHLYVFADQALQTMAVAGNSVAFVNHLPIDASTSNDPAIAFSSDRAMISAVEYAYPDAKSRVTMLDLTSPAIPKIKNAFSMPGQSTQLVLASGGILGPGQVSFEHGEVRRSLQKVTLFAKDTGAELDNLLLGTEYDSFESSWFAAQDDQRIRLGSEGTRMFLPYSGRHHAVEYEPTAHRLNITRIEGGRLVSERSFAVSDEIIRTAALDEARSLVFGDSATYLVDRTSGDWTLSTLREMFVPFATYRLSDTGLHARVDRVGSKCRVRTFAGEAAIFGETHLAEAEVPCAEGALPIGFGPTLLFAMTRTGVRISPDGTRIEPIAGTDVTTLLEKLPKGYCYIEGKQGGGLVDYLDEIPAKIRCVGER